MTQVQMDCFVLNEFGELVQRAGLVEWMLSSSCTQCLVHVPPALARHGCPKTAVILQRIVELYPPEAWACDLERFRDIYNAVMTSNRDTLKQADREIEAARENLDDAVDALYESHKNELPEPYFPEAKTHIVTNPFNGEPMKITRPVDPRDR